MPSLYNLHRPQKFGDLVGQEAVTVTLVQAIARDRLAHAYLFAGPKGSGKTTTARLLSKAVNCLKRKKGAAEPCNRCSSCQSIQTGNNLDVLEIDAASHRGIEEIRELRETVKFAPTHTSKKVYIIDEVHMLTREAFNALLKTLEEPPAHALFVLATTEPHKVPATIKSRTQQLSFRRAGIPDLVAYLGRIVKAEKIDIEEDALKLIAGLSEGSFRDAVASLEQIWSAKPRGKIKTADIRSLLGLADRSLVLEFLASLSRRDAAFGLQIVSELSAKGLDIPTFIKHALEMLRSELLLLAGDEKLAKASYTEDEVSRLRELAKIWDNAEVVNLIEELITAAQRLKVSPVPELPLEMLVAARAVSEGRETHPMTKNMAAAGKPATQTVPVAKSIEKLDEDIWRSILTEVKQINASLYAVLREAIVLGQTADGIALGVRFRFHAEYLSAAKNQLMLSDTVSRVLGHPAQITVEVKPEVFTKQEEELLKMAEELL